MKPSSQKLTVFLLKKNIDRFRDAVREDREVEWLPLRGDIDFEGAFAFRPSVPHPPRWAEFIAPAIDGSIEKAFNSSAYGVLFVRIDQRVFACTFGYGWSLLKPSCYEYGFGLRVALNRIDPTQLRSLDLLSYDDIVITTRRQTSRGSELGSFSLDVARDVLRGVVGKPKDIDWARSIGGKDAVTLRAPVRIQDLDGVLKELLIAYSDDSYKVKFSWIDHLGKVEDKAIVADLDRLLIEKLRSDKWDEVYLAPTEPVEWNEIDGFGFSGIRDKSTHDDPLLEEYFAGLGEENRKKLEINKLKKHHAGVFWSGITSLAKRWRIYNCLVWETEYAGGLYVLLAGRWFRVEREFARQVSKYVNEIDTTGIGLPKANPGEWETDYNKRVAKARTDLCLLDQKMFTLPGARTPIEVCDLISRDKQLIHVKRRTSSATLSHLFSQGTVSAEALLGEVELRKELRQYLKTINQDAFLSVIPEGRPTASDYEIVFAVIAKPRGNWPVSLPFFSQLNLMQRAKHLRTLGFKVRLVLVEVKEQAN